MRFFFKSFKVETLLIERIEKSWLYYFGHYNLRDTKELGYENLLRSKHAS